MPSPKKQCRTCGISINALSAGWCRSCWLQYHKDLREAIKSDEVNGIVSQKEQDGFRIGDRVVVTRAFLDESETLCDTALIGLVADICFEYGEEWIFVYVEDRKEYWPMCAEHLVKIEPLTGTQKEKICRMAEHRYHPHLKEMLDSI